jgi:hypothetical protein
MHFCQQKIQEDLAKMGVMIRHYDNKELKGLFVFQLGNQNILMH